MPKGRTRGFMETLKYIIKRILLSVFILFGVSIIIFALSRMLPTDYIDQTYSSALSQGTITQEDVDRIKDIYGLSMPDSYLTAKFDEESVYAKESFVKKARAVDKELIDQNGKPSPGWYEEEKHGDMNAYQIWYVGSYDNKSGVLRLTLNNDGSYAVYEVKSTEQVVLETESTEGEDAEKSSIIEVVEVLELKEEGLYTVKEDGSVSFVGGAFERDELGKITDLASFQPNGAEGTIGVTYRLANFFDKAGSILSSYFNWLFNLLRGDLGRSFKYGKPVGEVIVQNMGISFGISFVATILQFAIAIPLGIKAATNQYGVIDYTVTVLAMIGISLPTFFLANLFIRLFAVELGWFEVGGLVSGSLAVGATWFEKFADMLWHMVLPMLVLVILSIGGLMRYTRTNTLEVLNADYIRTARAKGLSEHTVIYKHAFRNTMIPLVTMLAGILPGLFSGAMITETVFSIPGIGKLAYDALVAGDIPFIMGYNMFIAILTVIGTLFSDLMYAVVDPRVKLGK